MLKVFRSRGTLYFARNKADFRLKPDPNRVPRVRTPEERFKNAQQKTGTIEDYQLYERQTPPNNINSLLLNGFKLDNGYRIVTESLEYPKGLLLLGHEAFQLNLDDTMVKGLALGRVEFDTEKVLGVFDLVHPKPELIVVGLGKKSRILGPESQNKFKNLGLQVDVSATRNAASHYNLLANERGQTVAALLLPPNI